MFMTDAHRFIRVDLRHTGTGEDFHYIDLAREMSAINHRLYRQGMTYHVANISVHDTQSSYLKFCTLPNTWPVKQAWKTGFRNWLEMNRRALEGTDGETASKASRFNDFRIYANDAHRNDTADRPRFTDVEGNLVRQDEYKYTRMHSIDGGTDDEFYLHMMGEHNGAAGAYNSVCLLEAYEETLTTHTIVSEEPEFDTGVWANMYDVGGQVDDIIDDLVNDYDQPPYDRLVFAGMKDGATNNCKAPWSVREVHIETANNSAMVGGFEAPCGLIIVETDNSADDNVIGLIIELAAGNYKGVAAEPMGTPKLVNGKKWKVD
ncbi:MAG: hypothetical protein [Circular genetic element sp.]|nr:MAG: hypothetical protein [Circular genetic element sp.]